MKVVRQMIGVILISIFFLCVYSQTSAYADTYKAINVKVPVVPLQCSEVEGISDDKYLITLTPDSNTFPKPLKDTLEIPEGGTGQFELSVTQPGTYTYKLVETPGEESKISYDPTVYLVTVYVETNDKDELVASVVITLDDKTTKPETVVFSHSLKSPPIATDEDVTIYTSSPADPPILVDDDIKPTTRMDLDSNTDDADPTVQGTRERPQMQIDNSGDTPVHDSTGDSDQVTPGGSNQPNTGDRSPFKAWIIILAAAAVVALISGSLLVRRRRQEA